MLVNEAKYGDYGEPQIWAHFEEEIGSKKFNKTMKEIQTKMKNTKWNLFNKYIQFNSDNLKISEAVINFCFTSFSFRAACNFLFSFSILTASSKHSIISVRINYNFMTKNWRFCILMNVLKNLGKNFQSETKGSSSVDQNIFCQQNAWQFYNQFFVYF